MVGEDGFILYLQEGSSYGSLGIHLSHLDDKRNLGNLLCDDRDNDKGVRGTGELYLHLANLQELHLFIDEILPVLGGSLHLTFPVKVNLYKIHLVLSP